MDYEKRLNRMGLLFGCDNYNEILSQEIQGDNTEKMGYKNERGRKITLSYSLKKQSFVI